VHYNVNTKQPRKVQRLQLITILEKAYLTRLSQNIPSTEMITKDHKNEWKRNRKDNERKAKSNPQKVEVQKMMLDTKNVQK